MPNRHRSPLPVQLVFILAIGAAAPGCQIALPEGALVRHTDPGAGTVAPPLATVPAVATPPAADVIRPQTAIQWSALTSQTFPRRGLRGQSVVKPDGRMGLGPYGSVEVAGLTAAQAKAAVIRHLATYGIQQPEVELAVLASPGSADSGVARVGHTPPCPLTVEVAPPDPMETPVRPAEILPPVGAHVVPGQAPHELRKVPLPAYVIEPPDILLVETTQTLKDQPVRGQHLVRPDGTIGLGIYGSVFVGGMTLEQAKEAIARQLAIRITDIDPKNLNVDVLAYNSKVYYVITDGGGYGEQVYRVPVTGSETVLDAIGQINGLPPVASKKHIWVARRSLQGGPEQVLPVDWIGITQHGSAETNYQVLPGDRIYVKADKWRTFDAGVAKVLSPFERILGTTLLGSEAVNSIRNRGASTAGGTTTGR